MLSSEIGFILLESKTTSPYVTNLLLSKVGLGTEFPAQILSADLCRCRAVVSKNVQPKSNLTYLVPDTYVHQHSQQGSLHFRWLPHRGRYRACIKDHAVWGAKPVLAGDTHDDASVSATLTIDLLVTSILLSKPNLDMRFGCAMSVL